MAAGMLSMLNGAESAILRQDSEGSPKSASKRPLVIRPSRGSTKI